MIELHLQDFYKAYLAWVDVGARNSPIFARDVGLCQNLRYWISYWVKAHGGCEYEFKPIYFDLNYEMAGQFIRVYNQSQHPFNANFQDYLSETRRKECYLNQARIDWVRDHV